MYAAEGSDWFWWYGSDQQAPGGDDPFDTAFRAHLSNVYRFARRAGAAISEPSFPPIIQSGGASARAGDSAGGGVMARGTGERQKLTLTCDARNVEQPVRLYVAGNLPALGDWNPNVIALHDDGTNGDRTAGDGIWSLTLDVPVGIEIHYKYSNNGRPGVWSPGEEFPARHRTLLIPRVTSSTVVEEDVFGQE
jgi:hypothetical protein